MQACVLSHEKWRSMGDAEGTSPLWRKGATAHYSLKGSVRVEKKFLETSSTTNLLCQDRLSSILDLV